MVALPLGRASPCGCAQQASAAQQQRRRQRRRNARSACPAAGQQDSSSCVAEQQQQQQRRRQQAERQPAREPPLQQLAQAAAGAAAAAVLALGALPPPAEAVLANPKAPVPRSAEVALRRSIPAFNADVAEVQARLEAIAFKLRIPQRKPWATMAEDAAAAAALAADRERMVAGVLPKDAEEADGLVDDVQATLQRLARAIEVKDAERTSIRVSNALEQLASLELLQAPGLPFQLPRQVAGLPVLAGRAVVDLTVEKASGERVFVDPNSSEGPQRRTKLRLVLDGYSAPVTAANLVSNFQAGLYNGTQLSVSGNAVLAGSQAPGAEAAAGEDEAAAGDLAGSLRPADVEAAAPAGPLPVSASAGSRLGGSRAARLEALPLEILAAGDFEPVYRSPLDVRNGELPVLPLSIYGAVAMAHLPGDSASGYVSPTQFFIYKFDRQQAGLAGLSFEEGEFGVAGYIVKGLDAVEKLESGDRIVRAEVVSGLDKII